MGIFNCYAQDVSQNVTEIEYFFDTDPGFGNGTSIDVTSPAFTISEASLTVTSGLAGGFHRLYVRVKSSAGLWSMPYGYLIYIDSIGNTVSQVTALEYYWDSDPGYGLGTSITISSPSSLVDVMDVVPTSSLTTGFHQLYIRAQDENSRWGIAESRLVYIDASLGAVKDSVEQLEYYWDIDPGYGLGAIISIASPDTTVSVQDLLTTDTLSTGFHNLFVRAKSVAGIWGMVESRLVYVDNSLGAVRDTLVAAEYYWDSDPGYGNGGVLSISEFLPEVQLSGTIATDTLSTGFHTLYTRVQNASGRWGMPESRLVYVDISGTTSVSQVDAVEYYWDTDPGYGAATPLVITTPVDSLEIIDSISTASVALGFHNLFLRVRDVNGSWGIAESRLVYVDAGGNLVQKVDGLEYFIDTDPGYGLASFVALDTPTFDVFHDFVIATSSVPEGEHLLGVRARSENGVWGMAEFMTFTAYQEGRELDSVALRMMYDALVGDNWNNSSNWLSTSIDQWYGISMVSNRVDSLHLSANNLVGQLPHEVGYLSSLKSLELAGNVLNDTIPIEAQNLVNLVNLDLSDNALTRFPDLSSITTLNDVALDNNYFDFSNLEYLIGIPNYTYSGQVLPKVNIDSVVLPGSSVNFTEIVGGTNNTYQWYLNGVTLPIQTTNTLQIDSFSIADTGTYHLIIQNTLVSGLDLSSGNYVLNFPDSLILPSDTLAPIVSGDSLPIIQENNSLIGVYLANEPASWTIIGIDSSSLSIAADGTLSFINIPDFEIPGDVNSDNIYDVEIVAEDSVGNVSTFSLSITVFDANDNAPVITDPGPINLDENSMTGTQLVSLEYTDADTTSTIYSWAIDSGNSDRNGNLILPFVIDSVGVIAVNDSSDIDYELTASYDLDVVLSDGINNDTLILSISVNDVLEDIVAPIVTIDTLSTIDSSPELTGSVDDTTSAVTLEVDGIIYTPEVRPDSTWFLASGTIADLSPATYDLIATATDSLGNIGIDTTLNELTILPGPPLALAASDVTYSGFTANWQPRAGALSYLLDISGNELFTSFLSGFESMSIFDTLFSVDGLDYGQTYYYRLRAIYQSDTSVYSNINSVTTVVDLGTKLDSLALLTIYDSLGGLDWSAVNWKTEALLRDWTGVTMLETRVVGLDLSSNNLTGVFPMIENGMDSVEFLNISNNEITEIRDLSAFVSLLSLDVSNNRLQFGSLEVVVPASLETTYGPQKNILSEISILEEIGSVYAVDRTVSGSSNNYVWYKNNELIDEETSRFEVSINNFGADGSYYAEVTNSMVPGITLTTTPVILKVSSLERDSLSLIAIYNALNGANSTLDDWSNLPINQWSQVSIVNSRVTELEVSSSGLEGTIPNDITDIQSLQRANFANNNLTGLPDLTGHLPNMTSFDMTGNQLTFEDMEPNVGVESLDFTNQQLLGVAKNEIVPVGSDYSLQLSVGGTANTYSWIRTNSFGTDNLGQQDSSKYAISGITYETMGTYVLEVSSSLVPDIDLISQPIEILASADINFTALDLGGDPFIAGEAFLLQITEPGEPFDSIQNVRGLGTGFGFESIILGDYIMAVAPDDLQEFLPTYYENTDLWTQADTLYLRNDFLDTLQMATIPTTGTEGAKVVGTVVSEFNEDANIKIDARRKVKRAGCSVRRFVPKGRTNQDEEGEYELYAYVQSDDEGYFEFTGLEDGKYRFNIEYPGIPMDTSSYVEFTIGEGGIEDEELILAATVTEEGIFVKKIDRVGFYRRYFKDLVIYPNPADQYIRINYSKLMKSSVVIQLVDIEGRLMQELPIPVGSHQELLLDVSELNKGIYMLNFIDLEEGSSNIISYKVYIMH